MKLLIVTPLYPPDIAPLALYVKELAQRLKETHTVTILAYNHIPEFIPGVTIVTIEKNKVLPIRLFHFIITLLKLRRDVDAVYLQNGPSVELPGIITSFLSKKRLIVGINDEVALSHAVSNLFYKLLLRLLIHKSHKTVIHHTLTANIKIVLNDFLSKKITTIIKPYARPEILPFSTYPSDAFHDYESSWEEHVRELTHLFSS